MGCAGLVGAYLWPMGGAPTVKSCYLLRLFGVAVGAWASTGDNWASPLEINILVGFIIVKRKCFSRPYSIREIEMQIILAHV